MKGSTILVKFLTSRNLVNRKSVNLNPVEVPKYPERSKVTLSLRSLKEVRV